jgi:hypothetical protein
MIYFIKYGNDTVKIGYTGKTIEKRIQQLHKESPKIEKEIILTMDGDKNKEKGLHDLFRDLCIGNEYFKMSDEIDSYIMSVTDAKKYKYDIKKICNSCGSDDIYYVMSSNSNHGYKMWCKSCGVFNGFLKKVLSEYVPNDRIYEERIS